MEQPLIWKSIKRTHLEGEIEEKLFPKINFHKISFYIEALEKREFPSLSPKPNKFQYEGNYDNYVILEHENKLLLYYISHCEHYIC